MKLNTLYITRTNYGSDAGKLSGEIAFIGEVGKVNLVLSDEHCRRMLEICAEAIVASTKEVAEELTREALTIDQPKLEEKLDGGE